MGCNLVHGRVRRYRNDDVEIDLLKHDLIQVDLYDMRSLFRKDDIRKERYIVSKPAALEREVRRRRLEQQTATVW